MNKQLEKTKKINERISKIAWDAKQRIGKLLDEIDAEIQEASEGYYYLKDVCTREVLTREVGNPHPIRVGFEIRISVGRVLEL